MSKKDLLFLNYNDECGTSAKDAYTRYAKRYNWDLSKASNFAPRKLLYACAVTPEGYSPWFVAHSNFISADDSNGKWLNRFENDLLFEEWLPDSSHFSIFGVPLGEVCHSPDRQSLMTATLKNIFMEGSP